VFIFIIIIDGIKNKFFQTSLESCVVGEREREKKKSANITENNILI